MTSLFKSVRFSPNSYKAYEIVVSCSLSRRGVNTILVIVNAGMEEVSRFFNDIWY